ncbi:YihY/virulence factor BrkB family protein [Nocardia altamirensis]|uniref:YihY/virulence factor BrkB family protein n=1 Tax=Nocardia altamirensis TaxID=472158 RepID=UPI0008405DB7|nr:YihY/virulence factor BrkB family protein [Nocardia altamirensis]
MPIQDVVAEAKSTGPLDLRWRTWRDALWRTVLQFWNDKLTDWAAALTYYGVLSLFPGIIVLTAMLGLLSPAATQSLIAAIQDVGFGSETGVVVDSIKELQASRSIAGPVAILGLLVALWTASGYVGAFIRAANSIYEVGEGRPMWKTIPLRIGLTLGIVLLVTLCAFGIVTTGSLADHLGQWLGIGEAGIIAWEVLKWPVLALVIGLVIALLYWVAPNAEQPGFRWLTPGSALAVLLWIAASAGFAFYAANFGSFNKVYGSLGGAVVFLIWLWLTNLAVLLGAAFDAELLRGRGIEQGHSPDKTPFLPLRDDPTDY